MTAGTKAGKPWRPGVFRNAPWLGLIALVVAILSAVATVAVLLSANGRVIDTWPSEEYPLQLAVVLAILIALGNAALRFAFQEGVANSWWVKMLKGGNLGDSHRYWSHGMSSWGSATELRHFSKVSLASLAMLLLIVDGPLLQRAASFTTETITAKTTLQVALSMEALAQSTGYYMTRAPSVNTLSPTFSKLVGDFTSRGSISLNLTGCSGTCTGTVVAAGWDTRCTTSTEAYNLDMDAGDIVMIGGINVTYDGVHSPGIISVSTMYKPDAAREGDLIKTECTLQVAQVRYPISISGGIVTLQSIDLSENYTVALQYPPIEAAGLGTMPSKLGGISYAVSSIYGSEVQIYQTGILALLGEGPMQYTYMTSDEDASGTVSVTWSDPTPIILEAMRELTFRAAIAFSTDSDNQIVHGTQQEVVNKYALHFGYLSGSLACILIGALTVTGFFQGYWLLGRKVSMSPLEIATAFQAPLTTDADSNAKSSALLKQVGHQKAKYGALHKAGGGYTRQTLAIAPPEVVSWPAPRTS
ncbi:uncharacterized protein DNG_04522 [Cephalotrichum gorgonifer]|uniref:Uncharacterized protein n=1 Tax=Cephalotrichum gorgonifer TaxID=2041049 RepID=A0AAE8MY58_9PEZI|nr:uncharacterized protein DNG_04522 [Cephalotrichum gorgonifer]